MLQYDDPWKHYGKWKKVDTKGHLLYDSIYMKYPDICKDRKYTGCQGLGDGERMGSESWLLHDFFLRWWKYSGIDSGDSYTIL